MAEYKVRIDEKVYRVKGLAGLVKLIQAGRLSPDDPVFIPRTGKWHYARSIRQLREHFATQTEAETPPEPPPENPRVARPDFQAVRREAESRPAPAVSSPPAASESGASSQAAADVLPLKRPARRRFESKEPVEVPVYSYDVEAETPSWVRRIFLAGIVLIVGLVLLLWVISERQEYAEDVKNNTVLATPRPTGSRVVRTPRPAGKTTEAPEATADRAAVATPRQATPRNARTPRPKPTQAPVDMRALRRDVNRLPKRTASSIEALEKQMVEDLVRLKVPVRSLHIKEGRARGRQVVPFTVEVVYAADDAKANQRRVAVGLVIGRAMAMTRLNVGPVILREHRGGKIIRTRKTTGIMARQLYERWNPAEFLGSLH